MGFKDIATPLASLGIPVIPLRPKTKIAFLPDWEKLATTDLNQIEQWDKEYPDANGACVAQAKLGGVWFLEIDRPEVSQRIESETGQKIPRTFRVRSSPGRGHYYWRQNNASLELGNIAQGFVKGTDWSARVENSYVVAPKSTHPKTGLPYEIVSESEIIEAPDWLIKWCASQKLEKKFEQISIQGGPIPYGAHDSTLARLAGKLRRDGVEEESLTQILIEVCEKRCVNYGSDYKEMCRKIAHSISRYDIAQETFTIGGKVPGDIPLPPSITSVQSIALMEQEEPPKIDIVPYPKFPRWVFTGTSIYEGLVKPYCDVNSRYPEYMFMPAMALLLNSVSLHVRIEHNKNLIPSLFMVLIGKKGRVIKSSSVQSAIEYMRFAGLVEYASSAANNANGKVLVWQAGSPEGLGLDMTRTNCKNAVLFYDELSTLTNKAGIDSSTLTQALLTTYESGMFSNTIKGRKETYSFEPSSYCLSLIACSTDKNFLKHWAKLSGGSSGLDDRFFFLMQPEILDDPTPQVSVDAISGAAETRKRIDRAIEKKFYKVIDASPFHKRIGDLGNRAELRAEKFALAFAIDLGLDEIDEECVERAIALVDYEKGVKSLLSTFEGTTKEASIQMELTNLLKRNGGVMQLRDIERKMHPERYGTSLWGYSYDGMVKRQWIREFGKGTKTDPKVVVLMRLPEDEDD